MVIVYCRCVFFLRAHVLRKRSMKSAKSFVDQGVFNHLIIISTPEQKGLHMQWRTWITVRAIVHTCNKYSNITFITVCTKYMYILYCLVEAVYDITLGFKKGEPSILGVMNADPCEIDILVRYTQNWLAGSLNQPIVYYALE